MNRAIATTAGALGILLGGFQAWLAFRLLGVASVLSEAFASVPILPVLPAYVPSLSHVHSAMFGDLLSGWPFIEVALAAVAALTLLIGGATMTARASRRGLIIGGCLIVLVHTGIGWALANWCIELGASGLAALWFNNPNQRAVLLLSIATPILVIVLAMISSRRQA